MVYLVGVGVWLRGGGIQLILQNYNGHDTMYKNRKAEMINLNLPQTIIYGHILDANIMQQGKRSK